MVEQDSPYVKEIDHTGMSEDELEMYRQTGAQGGRTTYERHGPEYYRELSRKGNEAKRQKRLENGGASPTGGAPARTSAKGPKRTAKPPATTRQDLADPLASMV